MLTSRPTDRDPEVQGANLRVALSKKKKPIGSPCLEYELYYKRETTEEWVIPLDSTFELPDWFDVKTEIGAADFVAWTENRGTTQRPDYEWVWIERASSYFKSKQSKLTTHVKKKMAKQHLTDLKTNFDQLFNLAMKDLDEE
jgi:hypothetical protein